MQQTTQQPRGKCLDLNGESAGHIFKAGETRVSFSREFTANHVATAPVEIDAVSHQVKEAIGVRLISKFENVRRKLKEGKYEDRCIMPVDTSVSKQFVQRSMEMIAQEFKIKDDDKALEMVDEYFDIAHNGYWDAGLDCHNPVSVGTVLIRARLHSKRKNFKK